MCKTGPSQGCDVFEEEPVWPPEGAVSPCWGGGQTPTPRPVFLDRFQACFFKPLPLPLAGAVLEASLLLFLGIDFFLT